MIEDFRLKVFAAVAGEGSFTKAAEKLGITQSAASQNVAELERQLGAKLFERNRGGVSLTPEGRLFSGYAEKIMYWYDAAGAGFSAANADGKVRICADRDIASFLLPGVLSSMISQIPGFRAEICALPRGGGECPPECDVEISGLFQGDSILWAEGDCAGVSPICAVAAPSDRNAYSGVSSLSGITGSSLAVWTGFADGKDLERAASDLLGADSLGRISLLSDSAEAISETVSDSGNVIGIVPYYAVYKKTADRTLSRLPLLHSFGAVAVWLRPSETFRRNPLYGKMLRMLSSELEMQGY